MEGSHALPWHIMPHIWSFDEQLVTCMVDYTNYHQPADTGIAMSGYHWDPRTNCTAVDWDPRPKKAAIRCSNDEFQCFQLFEGARGDRSSAGSCNSMLFIATMCAAPQSGRWRGHRER